MALTETLGAAGISGPSVVVVGTFDGVHLGHVRLVEEAARLARQRRARVVAITFNPRPAEILRPDVPSVYLCSLDERERLLRAAGADAIVVVPFTRELSQLSAEEFVRALVQNLGMVALVGGPDLALGHGREGTADRLRAIGARLGFDVHVVSVLEREGTPVRTRTIRALLEQGDVARVPLLLGRPFRVEGVVVRGDGRGRAIGVPTANLEVDPRRALPANGVYAVRFLVDGHCWKGAANLGTRPTFAGTTRSLEVHLLDFSGDLYGQRVVVEFVRRLRPEQRFGSVDELVRQIQADVQEARRVLDPP